MSLPKKQNRQKQREPCDKRKHPMLIGVSVGKVPSRHSNKEEICTRLDARRRLVPRLLRSCCSWRCLARFSPVWQCFSCVAALSNILSREESCGSLLPAVSGVLSRLDSCIRLPDLKAHLAWQVSGLRYSLSLALLLSLKTGIPL